jgi:hypothetical protein
LFNLNGVPRKNFYAFKAFRSLLDTPRRVITEPMRSGRPAICAGLNADSNRAAVLLSNFDTPSGEFDVVLRALPWRAPTRFEVRVVDAMHDFELKMRGVLGAEGRLGLKDLNAPAVVLINLSAQPAG